MWLVAVPSLSPVQVSVASLKGRSAVAFQRSCTSPISLALVGRVQLKLAWALPAVALNSVGAAGTASAGVAVTLPEALLLPRAFTARISKAYPVALVRPVTVWLVVPAPLPSMSAQVAVAGTVEPAPWRTWYLVMLLSFGLVQARSTWASPAVAARPVGAAGTVAGFAVWNTIFWLPMANSMSKSLSPSEDCRVPSKVAAPFAIW